VKVFLLDPAYSDQSTPGFLRRARERAGWDIVRPQLFESGVDGQRWLSDFERGLQEANIVIGLGDFVGLEQCGDKLDEALRIIRDKLEAGCPILLQGCSSLVSSQPGPPQERRIRDLLGSYGVHLTPIKVASLIQEVTTNSSPLCCVFGSDDNTLLDPSLFEDVSSVVAYGNRLISYEPGVFPLIEASQGLHYFVDQGDLMHRGNLRQRNAVAVTRRRGRQCLVVITGDLLSDPVEVIAGMRPSWIDNRQFADNLIDRLTAHVGDGRPSASATLYDIFRELETLLGSLIQTVLGFNSATGDLRDLIPESVQKKLNGPNGFDYSRATYIDLMVILRGQIGKFDSYFAQPAKDVLKLLFEINSGQRVNLAHPHRAAQLGVKFGTDDEKILKRALDLIRSAYLLAFARCGLGGLVR
jgi:hypothetical protein